jgi:hypothetical protein
MPTATSLPRKTRQPDSQGMGENKGGFLQGGLQDEGPQSPEVAWNPSGYWPDPMKGPGFRKNFEPHKFIGTLMQSPEAQRYADVEGLARSKGVQSVRGGEQAQIDETEQAAASQGLGRGYAQQSKQNIRQQGTMAATEMVMGAALESRSRQYQQAAQLAASLIESNKSRFTAYLNKKAQESAESAAITGGLIEAGGNILSSVLQAPGLFGSS